MDARFDALSPREGTGACKWDRRTDEEKKRGIVPLSIADMEFETAPCVKRAVMEAASRGLYGYTDPDARYFDAVLGWMRRRHGASFRREDVVCLYGVVPALHAAVCAFTEPGDEVILQTPVYYPFSEAVSLNGRIVAENPLIERDGRYEMDFDSLERVAKRPRAKLLLLCSPHNPVGRVWTRDELSRVARVCEQNGVVVVSDEIHFDLVLEGRHTPFTDVGRAIVCTSASKSFNLPGLQLANMLIPDPALREAFRCEVKKGGYSNISHFGYAATIAAYEGGDEWLDALLKYLRGNYDLFRAFFADRLPGAVVSPLEGTYLAWVNLRCLGLAPKELERFSRGEAGLVLDEGYIFGPCGEGYERFNLALPRDELRRALDRLDGALRARGYIR